MRLLERSTEVLRINIVMKAEEFRGTVGKTLDHNFVLYA